MGADEIGAAFSNNSKNFMYWNYSHLNFCVQYWLTFLPQKIAYAFYWLALDTKIEISMKIELKKTITFIIN